jgi:hypothetical protein
LSTDPRYDSQEAFSWKEQHMRQHPNPDPYPDEDEDLEALGTPVYEGSSLSVRALTADELQQFLDAHHSQPARPLGGGWAVLDPPPGHPLGVPPTPRAAPLPLVPGGPVSGSPGRSALAAYRRRRTTELAAWARTLVWRAPLVAAAGLLGQVLATQVGLPRSGLLGVAVAVLVGWRLQFRPSEQVTAWRRGAAGERRTARLLDRLTRDGYVVFHDLAMPGSPANVDHLVIGPTGVFVIDSKQWTGRVHQSLDGSAWHNHAPLARQLEVARWEADTIAQILAIRVDPLLCVHGADVAYGGLIAQGVAVVPAARLRSALGVDRVLSAAEVGVLVAMAQARLHAAA